MVRLGKVYYEKRSEKLKKKFQKNEGGFALVEVLVTMHKQKYTKNCINKYI